MRNVNPEWYYGWDQEPDDTDAEETPMADTYQRGTKTRKATSASLKAGDRILTLHHTALPEGVVDVARTKTGAIVRTVEWTHQPERQPFERQARRIIWFTDGTRSVRVAPSPTWHTIDNES